MYEDFEYSSIRYDPRQMELPFQDRDGKKDVPSVHEETGEGSEETTSRKIGHSFTVDEIEKHEDGSATYTIKGSEDDIQRLFEAFFLHSLVLGIESAEKSTEAFTARADALRAAEKLVKYLDVWEEVDTFDYIPDVEQVKNQLKASLKKAGV